MNISEDELEQRLRTLFADERLDLPPPPDAGTVIVAGARRRRRRRHVVQAVAGVAAAVVAVSGGLTMVRLHTEDGTAVMSADGTESSVKPPENLTQGRPPEPSTPGPTSTHDIRGSQPAGSPPSKTPQSSDPSPSRLPPVVTGPRLDVDGFGTVKLGMSDQQIAAQGVTLSNPNPVATCTVYNATGGGVPAPATIVVSKSAGLLVITPDQAVHTAEGIGNGATRQQVLAAYPGAKEQPGAITAPAATAEFEFLLEDSVVTHTSLSVVNADCAG
ncbi:hypothetical protein [Amycolatopsis vancoresmycina]|uniref:Uncharacterized protein n=1 Tax=Amycolatopsis vancoresmycina DSM 44592 TaxID=1292037 RepID=R1G9Z2_9PSEU|nr:hypothetical protein [Amycolatopsis vancoresmycina]EOD68188.1 hypothetical protein H480_12677 [Amycolatopsis vancoresmycina DSM 44592]